MDENFHIKSSIFGCLFSPILNHPNLEDYCLSFSIEWLMSSIFICCLPSVFGYTIRIILMLLFPSNILDVSCDPNLDVNFTLLFSSNIGCLLSSVLG